MKFFLSIATVLFISLSSYAQQFATTDDGKKVKLNDDKTWDYVNDSTQAVTDTAVKAIFTKPASSTAIIKSQKTDFGFWYNPGMWSIQKEYKLSPSAENMLEAKNADGYSIIVAEPIQVPMENLEGIIKQSKLSGKADDVVFEKSEFRMVNNVKVLYLKFSGSSSGIKFTYVGYFTSDESGTYQLMCYTSKNLFDKKEKDFMALLNGLVLIKAK